MKILLFALLTLSGLSAMARGYGEAGCGLGSIVMGKDGNQVLAATTNGSTYTNYFGITSGTSNCTDDGAMKSAMQVPAFIEVNKTTLAKEAARGEGETLSGLAQLMGCQSQKLAPALKANYNKVFVETQMQPVQIQRNIETVIQSNRAQTCGA